MHLGAVDERHAPRHKLEQPARRLVCAGGGVAVPPDRDLWVLGAAALGGAGGGGGGGDVQLYSAGELLEVQVLDEIRGDRGRSGEIDASC